MYDLRYIIIIQLCNSAVDSAQEDRHEKYTKALLSKVKNCLSQITGYIHAQLFFNWTMIFCPNQKISAAS